MENFLEKVFLYLAITLAILLPFSIVMYVLREKRAKAIKRMAEIHPKFINNLKRSIDLIRLLLWLSPLYIIFVPWAGSKYLDINGWIIFACLALMFANIGIVYFHYKWIYVHLSESNLNNELF